MIYSESDIRNAVSGNAFKAGDLYQRQGQVIAADRTAEDTLEGSVFGSERYPYEQTIHLTRHPSGRVDIEGDCTCPVAFNCKHVAAALLDGLRRKKSVAPAASALPLLADLPLSVPPPVTAPADLLPHDLMLWLNELDRARDTADETYPPSVTQRLVYVLKPVQRGNHAPRLGVVPTSTRLLKDGRFSDANRAYMLENVTSGAPAKFLRPSDLRILGALARLRRDYYNTDAALVGEAGAEILAELLATGRARWLGVNGPALSAGKPRTGRIAWQQHGDEAMRPVLEAGEGLVTLNAAPPVYVDLAAGLLGPVETGLAPKIADSVLDAPLVPAGHITALTDALSRRAPDLARVAPPPPEDPEVVAEAPVPRLRLFGVELPVTGGAHRGYYGYPPPRETVGLARLSFHYGGFSVPVSDKRMTLTRFKEGRLLEIRRDAKAERSHRESLAQADLAPAGKARRGVPPEYAQDFVLADDAHEWLDVMYHDIPRLKAQGWQIEVAETFPFRLLRGDGQFDATVRESSGIDWFELDVGILVEGERIDLIGPIVDLIASGVVDIAALETETSDAQPFYLPLGDGRILAVEAARVGAIVAAIQELAAGGEMGDGTLRLRGADAVGLAAFEAAAGDALVWRGGERLRSMGAKLGTAGIPEAQLPPTFTATLRPYQAQGVSWLAFLRDVGFGGVLADDMGLGKTVQALALITIEKAEGRLDRPVLVVAPTSLMANWRREAERFAPDLRVLTLQGLDRKSRFGAIGSSDLVLTTYPLIARDAVLRETVWHMLILDEAQTIKNPDATTTQLVNAIEARHRFCLSGTPLENHLGELWSLFSFALPGFLGNRQGFNKRWRTPIEKQGDGARAGMLARRIKPFVLRRTKEEVARDLPPKTEIVERIDLAQGQRDIYEAIRLSMHNRVRDAIAAKGFARSRIVILDALLKLRQACCDPRLLKATPKAAGKAGSAKLERLEEMLVDLLDEKRKILIFSQFTSMLSLIRAQLDMKGISYSLLTGDTRDRETEIRNFQDGDTPVFLVSLKAGGTGLNLTAADTVILYDPWWNPAVEDQAIDRAHRIGQSKPVFVHKLVATRSIEEKMETLKEKKRALAESLFDAEGAPTLAMTEADLDMLFEPD